MTVGATRVAVLNSHPIQYFAPMYAYLNRDPALEITALYCSDFSLRHGMDPGFGERITWDVDLLQGYPSVFLGERAKTRNPAGYLSLVCPEVWTEVRSGKYDVLWLHGYAYAVDLIAFLAAKSRGIPVFMRGDTHLGLARAPMRRRIRALVLTFAFRFLDGFLAVGTRNAEYYRGMGVSANRIHLVPYAVDNERFIAGPPDERGAVRRQLGIGEDEVVILFASKLTPRKRAEDLLRACASLESRGLRATLLMVGSGESKEDLESLARRLGLARVIFAGFVNQASLAGILRSVDVFVLPSESEPWGLIVNEAMCAGLPVIVTDEVGAAIDLVTPDNGFIYGVGDVETLANSLEVLVRDGERRRTMGLESLRIIREWSYEECREGLLKACRSVRERE
jgi:glycosyltransferase involved in cell wall biosynthesis